VNQIKEKLQEYGKLEEEVFSTNKQLEEENWNLKLVKGIEIIDTIFSKQRYPLIKKILNYKEYRETSKY